MRFITWLGWRLLGTSKQKLAVKHLHKQPKGFTREDVRWQRELATWLPRQSDTAIREAVMRMNDLADRIEARLPPEDDET